jgi:hypothetical protein
VTVYLRVHRDHGLPHEVIVIENPGPPFSQLEGCFVSRSVYSELGDWLREKGYVREAGVWRKAPPHKTLAPPLLA